MCTARPGGAGARGASRARCPALKRLDRGASSHEAGHRGAHFTDFISKSIRLSQTVCNIYYILSTKKAFKQLTTYTETTQVVSDERYDIFCVVHGHFAGS